MSAALPRTLLALVLALAAALVPVLAEAAVGMTELRGVGADRPVTVFYPTRDAEARLQRGPFTLQLAFQGKPERGNGRLVVLSHGAGGSAITLAEVAQHLAGSGFTVAVPEHRGDNWQDMADIGPASWKRRPAEVSRAIDAVAADARFAGLALDRVGVWGMSAGGLTALVHAGGRWSPSTHLRHCEGHLADDFPACVGLGKLQGDAQDAGRIAAARTMLRMHFDDRAWNAHRDPRVAAVVAVVPLSTPFDPA